MTRPAMTLRPVLSLGCADASGHRAGPGISARAPTAAPALQAASTTTRLPVDTAPVHDARALTGGGQEARIVLDGAVYTLRVTRQRKLILTK